MNKKFSCFIVISIGLTSSLCEAAPIEIDNITFADTSLKVGAGQQSISVSDLNSDGHQDVIIANYSENNIVTYEGNGKGELVENGRYSVGDRPSGVDVADINDDGNLDIFIANHETSYVTLLVGDGEGGFKHAPQSPFNIDIKPHPHEVRLKDLDSDGNVDLIVDSRTHEGLRVLKGADGSFKKPGKIISAGGDPYRGFAINDLNGDGHLDIVTPNQRDVGVIINSGTDEMTFSLSRIPQSESPFAVELGELNGDGKLDLVVATNGTSVSIIPGDGSGGFDDDQKTTITTSSGAKQIAIGDINGDGIEDALISNWSGEIIAALGSKTTVETISFELPNIANPWGIALADLNGDGKSDFIIADGSSESAVVYVSRHSQSADN